MITDQIAKSLKPLKRPGVISGVSAYTAENNTLVVIADITVRLPKTIPERHRISLIDLLTEDLNEVLTKHTEELREFYPKDVEPLVEEFPFVDEVTRPPTEKEHLVTQLAPLVEALHDFLHPVT